MDTGVWMFIAFLFLSFLYNYLEQGKKIGKYLKEDFEKMGYRILSERRLKFSEMEFKISLAPLWINGAPASRYKYKKRFVRMFEVETKKNERYELNTVVTNEWNGTNTIEIKTKTKID